MTSIIHRASARQTLVMRIVRGTALKALKGRSSRLLRQEFSMLRTRLPTLWTNSYFVATTGGAPLVVIKRYIERQKEV